MISIIIPYLSNSESIRLCKEKILENTKEVFEIVEIVDCRDVYAAYNDGVEKAKYENIVFLNDDMIVAPGWDKYIVKHLTQNMIMTQYLVECGNLKVNENNIEKDFGKTVELFDYQAFCDYVSCETKPEIVGGFGWFMPFMIKKQSFIPYPNIKKYPWPNDMSLFKAFICLEYNFVRINSFAYHFQGLSRRTIEKNAA